jgi:hypothetical protein
MFIVALISALLCTVGACLAGLLIKWVITQVGVTIFASVLAGFAVLFLLVGGNKDE